jgi:glycosyltransferase involved in cell wall biosynthesis
MARKSLNQKLPPVSVVVPMKNSSTTLISTLESIEKQKYPVKEIIIVDNVSADNSLELARKYKKKSKIPIHILKNKKNIGVGASYNRGVEYSSESLVVFMHSDSSLSSSGEMKKLVTPLIQSSEVVATFPIVFIPDSVWMTYNFWQKCLFARAVGKDSPGFNGKFDCLRRDAFLSIGGFDTKHYGHNIGIGSEDADLYLRLRNKGLIVLSEARVIHLHYMGGNYKLSDWIKTRKLLAKSYGRLIRLQGTSLPLQTHGKGLKIPLGMLLFTVKPILCVLPFIPIVQLIGIPMIFAYIFINSRKMYTTTSTLLDVRILLLPFIELFLLYAEVFWMFEALLFIKKKV